MRPMEMMLEHSRSNRSWYHGLRDNILCMLGRFEEAPRAFNLVDPSDPGVCTRCGLPE